MSGWTVDTLKEHYDRRLVDMGEALRLQHAEYQRRLGELNHAHERAEEDRKKYVLADKYETSQKAETLARELALERQDARLKALERFVAKATGVGVVVVLFAGLVGAAVVKALGG